MVCTPTASSRKVVVPEPPSICNSNTVAASEPNALVGTAKLEV